MKFNFNYEKPKVVAEIGCNHMGSMEIAKELIDLAKESGSSVQMNRAAFLIPIAKAFSTDNGCRVSDIGIQVHGGLGFIESSGVPQLYRDVRITAIYEGTNGIQGMDLVNRKLSDGGTIGFSLIG